MKNTCRCGREFKMERASHKFCSYKCWTDSKIGKVRTNYHGYNLVHLPDHPLADHRGNVYEHRLVMMGRLGRLLEHNEMIHHKNGVKNDNRIENLEIIIQLPKNGSHKGEVKCPHCEKTFSIR